MQRLDGLAIKIGNLVMRSIQVIRHRGNKAAYAENTLHGFESFFTNTEFDGIELDALSIDSYAWKANSKSDWARLKDIGVTGIITDRPKDLANWLKE